MSVVDGPTNLVRVPKYKHHDITGWFARGNERYGNMFPREYLRGKSWEERFAIGLSRLLEEKVVKS